MKHKVAYLVIEVVIVGLMAAPAWAAPIVLTDIQYWLAPDHIQTIISFDHAVNPSYHHRSNPERFVLEIPNCEDIRGGQNIPVDDVTLQRIRVQRLNNGTTQVVFDLTENVDVTVEILPRFNGQPDRVAVNLFDRTSQTQDQPQVDQTQGIEPLQQDLTQGIESLQQDFSHILVIDPGHGGRDPGAIGPGGLKEKDIVLDIARAMQKSIQEQAPNINVYLTRDGDYFLPLQKRTEIARDYNADLFISLHVNANPRHRVKGFSVYTLSEKATDEAARRLAEQENSADLLFGGIATPVPEDDSLLNFVLADLSATAALQHSLEFGRIAVNTTVANLTNYRIHKEGLKRANFVVLRFADMPAVLVEACYISNKREAKLLNQKEFRRELARSLAKSTIDYFAKIHNSVNPHVVQLRKQPSVLSEITPDVSPPSPSYKVHVVKSGESLSVIAGKYKVKLAQLRQVNQLASADLIYVGQRLWIP